MNNIQYEENGFTFEAVSFDKKKNLLIANKFDKEHNLIKKVEVKMAQIPKKVKQKLNPLK